MDGYLSVPSWSLCETERLTCQADASCNECFTKAELGPITACWNTVLNSRCDFTNYSEEGCCEAAWEQECCTLAALGCNSIDFFIALRGMCRLARTSWIEWFTTCRASRVRLSLATWLVRRDFSRDRSLRDHLSMHCSHLSIFF